MAENQGLLVKFNATGATGEYKADSQQCSKSYYHAPKLPQLRVWVYIDKNDASIDSVDGIIYVKIYTASLPHAPEFKFAHLR